MLFGQLIDVGPKTHPLHLAAHANGKALCFADVDGK
jgi:hypothetical protein